MAVASNPELLREGAAIRDFKLLSGPIALSWVRPTNERAKSSRKFIGRYTFNKAPIMYTAEVIKYAANAFLATKITFINEMADLAEKVGVDVNDVARGIGLDNRIGPKFLHAGPGFWGLVLSKRYSCPA